MAFYLQNILCHTLRCDMVW